MKPGIFTALLLSVFLASCSAGGTQSEPMLERKELTGDEQRYLEMGLDYSMAYNVTGAFPEQIQTAELIMNVYEDGEKLDEASMTGFQVGVNDTEEEHLQELLFALDYQENGEEEAASLEALIGDRYVRGDKDISHATYSTRMDIPFEFSGIFTMVPQIPIEVDGISYLAIMTSGNTLTTRWYKEENRKHIINSSDEKVIIFGIKWLDEKPQINQQ
ncbi:hypothetical protein [Salibacterium sp. K-3]